VFDGANDVSEREFQDHDFLRVTEGFFFCVVGPYHPTDRVISYLKYVPDPKGTWSKGTVRLKRVLKKYTIPNLLETFEILRKSHRHYLFFSPVYNIQMTAVPHEHIEEHFEPEPKLQQLLGSAHLDPLQDKLVRLVALLAEISDVPLADFGVTGSLLLDIHNPRFSDMDITIHGKSSSQALKYMLAAPHSHENSGIKPFEGERLEQWLSAKTRHHPLNLAEAKRFYGRQWNIGVFDGTPFSVHPIKRQADVTETYGSKTYNPIGEMTLKATVLDSADSLFLPAVYRVGDVEIEGDVAANIEEVTSYEGLYCSLAENGETILVKGKLEHVIDHQAKAEYDRVLVGSPEGRGREYIKPVETGI
jgi:predicted nucleotidyltransferase